MLLLCNYYVTYRCNAYCEFCHFSNHDTYKTNSDAALEDFKSNVNQIAKLGVKFIDLTGGEPLLNSRISEMAKYARNHKMQTSITTNTLLYPKFAEKLAGNINLLHFSLDAPVEEEHNRIRKVDCYKSVFKSIEIAKSLGEYPDLLFTVTNNTYKKLNLMYDIALKYDIILMINPVFSYFGNPGLSMEAIEYIESFIQGKSNIYINNGFLRLRKHGGNNILKPSCKAVSRVIVISPNNEIILPCYHFGNYKIKIDKPVKDILASDSVKDIKKMEGRFEFCSGCTVNCYFEPSFAFPTNIYALSSLKLKFKYSYHKLIKQKLYKKL